MSDPNCPECSSSMVLRTARRGANAGNQFWGCSNYPKCKGTRDYEEQAKQGSENQGETPPGPVKDLSQNLPLPARVPVPWSDRISRQDWIVEYTTIGSMAGFAREAIGSLSESELDVISQTLLLTTRNRERAGTDDQRYVASLITKTLQRGRTPLPTLTLERDAIQKNGLDGSVSELTSNEAEVGFLASRGFKISKKHLTSTLTSKAPFILDSEFTVGSAAEVELFDTPTEEHFLTRWIAQNLPEGAGHWFIPQANLDRLLEAAGAGDGGSRRVDFLFAHPYSTPLVIEIDGSEHQDDPSVDAARDELLKRAGLRVIRVSNQELEIGDGASLDAIRAHCEKPLLEAQNVTAKEQDAVDTLVTCINGSKLQLSIARALQYGWLPSNGDWALEITGERVGADAAIIDLLQLAGGFDALYGTEVLPSAVSIRHPGGEVRYEISPGGEYLEAPFDENSHQDPIRISLEQDHSPFSQITSVSDIIIRPAFLPVQLSVESSFSSKRQARKPLSEAEVEQSLTPFLQQIFRKREFRPLQAKSVMNALHGVDSIVLLPTGAGKSIIYQLAGLLMPGVTLVVDPIVSLIEDQVEGLQQYGIDRAVGITSAMNTPEERERLLRGVERGAYQFVLHSPERLQSPAFRSTLRALAETSQINLAVIDEAHCVSEWGHDFRPAYLNLGRNLRTFGKDRNGSAPTLIALTGTASRSVLRDVLAELDIDKSNSNALIRPHSFDRGELHFHISRPERTDDAAAALRGMLHQLPDKFGLPKDEFYRPSGRNTASGIVFVPFVNGRTHGVLSTKDAVRTATGANVTLYSGKAPKGQDRNWEIAKRSNVREFKSNDAPVLVSTKAFGMGIDKPNIRYTVHLGMPGSLEGFYQEAGRAGRDRRDAHCSVVFTEFDSDRSDSLLDPSISLEEARARYDSQTTKRKNDDDVTRALWFHLNSFTGQDEELVQVERILDAIDTLEVADTYDLPFGSGQNGRSQQERALFRLVKVGVIRDYEVIYGSQIFRCYIAPFDLDVCKNSLLEYVQSAQPGRVKVFAQELDKVTSGEAKSQAATLAKLLIDFTYDVIERSRRRAIQEAILLARRSASDKEIRTRLLDYLQEGVGSEAFESLLNETQVELGAWQEFIDKTLSPIDAGEMRGMSIRSLESYPDHPGLLLVRGISEMLCSDADETTAYQALHALLKASGDRYAISNDDLTQTFSWMLDIAKSKAPSLGLPLASAFYFAAEENLLDQSINDSLGHLLDDVNIPEISAVKATINMGAVASEVSEAARNIASALDDAELKQLIGNAA